MACYSVTRIAVVSVMFLACSVAAGCSAMYCGVSRPAADLKPLAPELAGFTDETVEAYLKSRPEADFPCTPAIAKLGSASGADFAGHGEYEMRMMESEEAEGWRKLVTKEGTPASPVEDVHFITPMLSGAHPDLKRLRHVAAMLHAPILLVYIEACNSDEGRNAAAMGYWTIVGLFVVPGHTVGHHSVCQALLVDTRTGLILATAEGDAKREENVLPGAVEIAARRVERRSRAEAVAGLQADVIDGLRTLATNARK